jgi:hypothetical protein
MSARKYIFIVTSVINSVYPSKYSKEERYAQTLQTIESINQYAPHSIIFIIEGSDYKWPDNIRSDNLHVLYKDSKVDYHKSIGEISLLKRCLYSDDFKKCMEMNNIELIFKISGRYVLNESFKICNFQCDSNIVGAKFDFQRQVIHTTLYSIKPTFLDSFCLSIDASDFHIKANNTDIEHALYHLCHETIKLIPQLGLHGTYASDGAPYNI